MRLLLQLLLLLSLLTSCADPAPAEPPADDDDSSDDDDSADDDDDSAEPPDLDWDDDGLPNEFEDQIGTDPTRPDSDSDGYDDGDEYLNYFLPNDPGDYPYIGGYPRGPFEEAYSGEGFEPGQLSATWSHLDQYGQELQLHRFAGNVVLIYIDYEDAPGLGHIAPEVEAIYQARRSEGFVVLHFLTAGLFGPAGYGPPFAQRYIEEHGLTFPVFEHPAPSPIATNYHLSPFVPHWTLLNRDLRIVVPSLSGHNDWPAVLGEIDVLLAEPAPDVGWPLPR